MMRRLLIVVAGCGRIGFDATGDDGDTIDVADAADAQLADAAALCTFGTWGSASNLANVNTNANDWSPTLSADGLELIWETTRTGNQQLFRATRAATSDPFSAVTELTVLNTPQAESSPSLSRDRLTLYFSSSRTGQSRLYRATRADKDAAFDPPAIVPELANVEVLGPAISASGDEVFYNNLNQSQISRAVLSGGTWSVAGVVTELGTNASAYPDLSHNGLTIYFDTNSSVLNAAVRAAPGATFSMPAPVPGAMNSSSGEADAELGDADRQMVFSSNRTGGAGNWDIWTVTRPCD